MPVPVPVPVWEEPGACAAAAMSFVRALATRLVLNQRKFQEELDVWRLYHLVHYWRVCRGREVRVPRPDEVSSSKQYRAIHSAVTSQVRTNHPAQLSYVFSHSGRKYVGGALRAITSAIDPSQLAPPFLIIFPSDTSTALALH